MSERPPSLAERIEAAGLAVPTLRAVHRTVMTVDQLLEPDEVP